MTAYMYFDAIHCSLVLWDPKSMPKSNTENECQDEQQRAAAGGCFASLLLSETDESCQDIESGRFRPDVAGDDKMGLPLHGQG